VKNFLKTAIKKLERLSLDQVRPMLLESLGELDLLEAALNSMTQGVMICDSENKIMFINHSAGRFFNIIESVQGSTYLWNVIEDIEISSFLQLTLLSGDKIENREFTVRQGATSQSDSPKRISINVLPLVQARHITGSIVTIDDITEKHRTQAKIRQIEQLASLTTLSAGVAHEIKNPLGSISIHIQLIQKSLARAKESCIAHHKNNFADTNLTAADADTDTCAPFVNYTSIEKYLSVVNDEIERLNGIVVDFLQTVRPLKLDMRPGNINKFLHDLLDFFSFELSGASINCILKLDEKVPLIFFDESALKQAILNLIKNAKEAMPNGGVLTISTESLDSFVLIVIEDSGIGIKKEELDKIFEPYWTTKKTGNGLGLLMVFKIIREHLGDISVRSEAGIGTVFEIALPVPQFERPLLTFKETSA
jgi:signal transduction histidine kinase